MEIFFVLFFFNVKPVDVDTFFVVLIPLPKGHGEVSRFQSSGSSLPLILECALGKGVAGQLPYHLWNEEKVSWGKVQRVRQVLGDLEMPGCHPVRHHGGSVQALSQWNHQSLAAISGLFCLKIFRNLSRASVM